MLSPFFNAEMLELVELISACEFFRNIRPGITLGPSDLMVLSPSIFRYYQKVHHLKSYAQTHDYILRRGRNRLNSVWGVLRRTIRLA